MDTQDLELSDLIGMEIALHTAIAILQDEDEAQLEAIPCE